MCSSIINRVVIVVSGTTGRDRGFGTIVRETPTTVVVRRTNGREDRFRKGRTGGTAYLPSTGFGGAFGADWIVLPEPGEVA